MDVKGSSVETSDKLSLFSLQKGIFVFQSSFMKGEEEFKEYNSLVNGRI